MRGSKMKEAFEYYIRIRIDPSSGRALITFSPYPRYRGVCVTVDTAIQILEREKERFNQEMDEIIRVLKRIRELKRRYI